MVLLEVKGMQTPEAHVLDIQRTVTIGKRQFLPTQSTRKSSQSIECLALLITAIALRTMWAPIVARTYYSLVPSARHRRLPSAALGNLPTIKTRNIGICRRLYIDMQTAGSKLYNAVHHI